MEPIEKIKPDVAAGSTILPIAPSGGGGLGPPLLGPISDPNTPGFVPVPEPATIGMMLLGSGCLGALTALRRRRRG